QSAIGQCAMDALRHQVDRAHIRGDGANIGFGGADDGGAATDQALHHAPSAGANTGIGGSSPPGRCTRNFTRMPMCTAVGAMSSTRLIMRNPSSTSTSATL